jgi:hypothetical protein
MSPKPKAPPKTAETASLPLRLPASLPPTPKR